MRRKHGLGDAFSPGARQAVTEQAYGPVIGAITQLLDAGQRDGTIRADADPVISSSSPGPSGGPHPGRRTARSPCSG
jgi:hypothetical protein